MSKLLENKETIPSEAIEAGDAHKMLIISLVLEKGTHRFIEVFLREEDAKKFLARFKKKEYFIKNMICS